MLVLDAHITIGSLLFTFVNEVSITSSWQDLTDTCTIKLPRNVQYKGETRQGEGLRDLVRKGDSVKVQLGYGDGLNTEFEGFVARNVQPQAPIVVECEDPMWNLKQSNHSQSWRNATLKEVVAAIAPGIETEVVEASLGAFSIKQQSGAQALEKIKETYGLVSYFRGGTLVVGFPYTESGAEAEWHFQQNIDDNKLEYTRADDVKIKVKAISMLPDNKKIEVEVGDDDGEQRTLTYYNITEAQLKKNAEEDLKRLRYDGYRGSLSGFGLPFARHGDIAVIRDNDYPERAGKYYIDKTVTTFGVNGFRREVHLGVKAA